jgi:hypothetical protein
VTHPGLRAAGFRAGEVDPAAFQVEGRERQDVGKSGRGLEGLVGLPAGVGAVKWDSDLVTFSSSVVTMFGRCGNYTPSTHPSAMGVEAGVKPGRSDKKESTQVEV